HAGKRDHALLLLGFAPDQEGHPRVSPRMATWPTTISHPHGPSLAYSTASTISSSSERGGSMSSVTKSIEVNVPVHVAYNQWTQFEEFPKFMDGVQAVQQLDDKHLHWRAKIGGKEEEWDAEITEQILDRRIAWRSTSGTPNAGVVTFQSSAPSSTQV